ncbi:MAG: hypothetical protein MZV64_02600 [Ignavibacteriales bacterium]|nr:hypothetical protein [Ignavibacteriales bacterium]
MRDRMRLCLFRVAESAAPRSVRPTVRFMSSRMPVMSAGRGRGLRIAGRDFQAAAGARPARRASLGMPARASRDSSPPGPA